MLTHQACYWLDKVKDIVPTHLIERPDAQIAALPQSQATHGGNGRSWLPRWLFST